MCLANVSTSNLKKINKSDIDKKCQLSLLQKAENCIVLS